jgi:ribosome-binding protein aMBF1 (putative translation factor)
MTREVPVGQLGSTAEEAAARRYRRGAVYREQHDRLAPYRAIAKAVIHGRGALGLTQEKLGRLIGTTGSAISRIESGTRSVQLETLAKLGQALDIRFIVGAQQPVPGCILVPIEATRPGSARPGSSRGEAPVTG